MLRMLVAPMWRKFPLCPHISQFSVLTQILIYLNMCFQCTSAFCMLSPSFGGWAAVSAQFCFCSRLGSRTFGTQCHGWPSLQGQEIAQLKASFKNPQHLEAAFDDDRRGQRTSQASAARDRTRGPGGSNADPGKVERSVSKAVQSVEERLLIGMMEQLSSRMGRVPTLQETYASEARMNPLVCCRDWRGGRKALRTDRDASQRAEHERLAREKYTALLADVIKEAQLPLVAILSEVDDPESAWKRIFGNRRSKTLRNRYRSWRAFEKWLTVIYGKTWPTSIAQLLAYINQRVEEGCG